MALDHHPQRIADQQDVDPGVVTEVGEARIICGQHRDLRALARHLRERRDVKTSGCGGRGSGSGCRVWGHGEATRSFSGQRSLTDGSPSPAIGSRRTFSAG